jgi:hypothetical protein
MAVKWGGLELLQKVWEWANEKLTSEEINNILLLATDEGRTVFHMAAKCDRIEVLQKVCEWANDKVTTEGISE